MIVKVQLSTYTELPVRQVLIYNKDRSVEWQGDITPEIERAMGDTNKAFFEAKMRGTVIELMKRVGGRPW